MSSLEPFLRQLAFWAAVIETSVNTGVYGKASLRDLGVFKASSELTGVYAIDDLGASLSHDESLEFATRLCGLAMLGLEEMEHGTLRTPAQLLVAWPLPRPHLGFPNRDTEYSGVLGAWLTLEALSQAIEHPQSGIVVWVDGPEPPSSTPSRGVGSVRLDVHRKGEWLTAIALATPLDVLRQTFAAHRLPPEVVAAADGFRQNLPVRPSSRP